MDKLLSRGDWSLAQKQEIPAFRINRPHTVDFYIFDPSGGHISPVVLPGE